MRLHRTTVMTGVALAAMVTAAPIAAQAQSSPETGTGTADERLLDCRAEFRALQETLRSEPGFADVRADFERLAEGLTSAEPSDAAGVCFANLVEARQMLAENGIVLEGYTDDVAIYTTIEEARAAGAFTDVEAEEARQRTHVTVETRPARVAVTPQQARVMIEREATQVSVNQRAPEITVRQPQAQIDVQQAQPSIDVAQPAPEVSVQAAAPEVEVMQPAPDIQVQQAQPQVDVASGAQVTSSQAEGEVTVSVEDEPAIQTAEAGEMPRRLSELESMALEEIEFGFDSAELSDIAIGNVEDAVRVMRAGEEEMRAVLVGYASPIGNEIYNLQLSRERVEAVRQAMIERGIDPDRIVAFAEGEDEAEAEQDVADAETVRTEENRRVDIRIIPETTFARAAGQATVNDAGMAAQDEIQRAGQGETTTPPIPMSRPDDEGSGQGESLNRAAGQGAGQGGTLNQEEY